MDKLSGKIRNKANDAGEYTPISINTLDDWADEVKQLEFINAELLEACLDASCFLMGKARRDPEEREIVFKLNEATQKAKDLFDD